MNAPFPRLKLLPAHCSGHYGEGNSGGGPQIRREILRNRVETNG
jgi:hypothetical protein